MSDKIETCFFCEKNKSDCQFALNLGSKRHEKPCCSECSTLLMDEVMGKKEATLSKKLI